MAINASLIYFLGHASLGWIDSVLSNWYWAVLPSLGFGKKMSLLVLTLICEEDLMEFIFK